MQAIPKFYYLSTLCSLKKWFKHLKSKSKLKVYAYFETPCRVINSKNKFTVGTEFIDFSIISKHNFSFAFIHFSVIRIPGPTGLSVITKIMDSSIVIHTCRNKNIICEKVHGVCVIIPKCYLVLFKFYVILLKCSMFLNHCQCFAAFTKWFYKDIPIKLTTIRNLQWKQNKKSKNIHRLPEVMWNWKYKAVSVLFCLKLLYQKQI